MRRGTHSDEEHLKLTTYFGERDRIQGELLGDALLDLYGRCGLRTSVLLRGAEGFGRLHRLHSDRLLTLSEDLPVLTTVIDTRQRVEAVLARVLAIMSRGLLTLERVRVRDGEHSAVEELGDEVKLSVHLGRYQRVDGTPAHVVAVDLLRRHGLMGAMTLLGVDGTARGRRVRARFLASNAQVPMVVLAIGSAASVTAALPELRTRLGDPLVALERVRICKRDGRLLTSPPVVGGTDEHGLPMWQKLTVYSSQAATHGADALHLAILKRLRQANAGGATSVRGVWGFHGTQAPHGDRLLQLRRNVPVMTVAIDTPEHAARSFQVIDELTAEHGLLVSETVPALVALREGEQRHGSLRMADPRS